ncbi:MAG: hemolysin family protein [Deltaproteobacteria bacterium]|nr:hemolysin family protein [Deltaproteobacteria bacterium]
MASDSDRGNLWSKITKFFSGKNADHVEQAIIEASQDGELEADEGSMLLSILRMDDLQVQEIMTPRTDITAVEETCTVAEAIEAIVESGHSRIPIYRENRDNIVGVLYAKDLLEEAIAPDNHQKPVSGIMRPAFFVPETKNVLELLNEFKSKKNHMAVILDEYGGTSGLVTIEDVLEEIVGDIEDEHDAPKEADIVALEGGQAFLSGRAYLEDINAELGTSLASEEVETIGGLLSHIAGCLPGPGDEFVLGELHFKVKEADNKHVHKVLVSNLPPRKSENHADAGSE